MEWRCLVPELVVSDFASSLNFYTSVLGFAINYRRTEPGFAYLEFESSQIMIEEVQPDSWVLDELRRPFGRGMNLMIECRDVAALRAQVAAHGVAVYRDVDDAWYEAGDLEIGVRQFIVADPDGYLLRFAQPLGRRVRAA